MFSQRVLIGRGLDLRIISFHLFIRFSGYISLVGANGGEDPPVPIPNTEVKLTSVEDTWLATARENRAVPTQ